MCSVYGEDPKGQPYLNFVRLLVLYVKNFAYTDVLAALHYLFLIQDENIRCILSQSCKKKEQEKGRDYERLIYKWIVYLCTFFILFFSLLLFSHHCIKDLILETREFDQLLGLLQPDGSRKV
jgi:hypothetical protein